MMRSMYSGVSGLKNHQTRMDIIGNNIANVNTVGYKKSRVVVLRGLILDHARASLATAPGAAPTPCLSAWDDHKLIGPDPYPGSATVQYVYRYGYRWQRLFHAHNGGQIYYSRAGNFDFDTMGYLVSTSNGYRVQGWVADANGIIDTVQAARNIDISAFRTIAPKATENVVFSGNLNSTLTIPQIAGSDNDPADGGQHPAADNAVITSGLRFTGE